MKITGLHLLLSYTCTSECDHCFVWGSPETPGVMSLSQIRELLREAAIYGAVDFIYLEGGEPFLFYPIMVKAAEEAKKVGFKVGIVTNAYWATSQVNAEEWLRPLVGIDDLSASADLYHCDVIAAPEVQRAVRAARKLSIPVNILSAIPPGEKGEKLTIAGVEVGYCGLMYKGRAAVRLAVERAKTHWEEFTTCPCEDFERQERVHIDPLGFVHVCQGIAIGNVNGQPLSEMLSRYQPRDNPILRLLLEAGPVGLVKEFVVPHGEKYADACHLCYEARLHLRGRFPHILAPGQMYGAGLG